MSFLLYGAYGYTGELIAREARARGLEPTLAGRDAGKLRALARDVDLPHRVFSLDDEAALEEATADADLVLHCAGPFARTVRPVLNACIQSGTHYLDITGEIDVFEYVAGQGPRAEEAGVMLMPGVGFDVVPTDCLAAHLKQRQPEAEYLELAIFGVGGISRGTAMTAAMNAGRGGVIRKDGQITRVPAAWRTRQVDFGRGPTEVVSIPWGDVATAWRTTEIPNIITYARLPEPAVRAMRASRYIEPLLRTRPAQAFLRTLVEEMVEGPSAQTRERGRSFIWGKARRADGTAAEARLSGPETYSLTVQTALAAVQQVIEGNTTPGFQTPGGHFGPDFILGLDDTHREDLE